MSLGGGGAFCPLKLGIIRRGWASSNQHINPSELRGRGHFAFLMCLCASALRPHNETELRAETDSEILRDTTTRPAGSRDSPTTPAPQAWSNRKTPARTHKTHKTFVPATHFGLTARCRSKSLSPQACTVAQVCSTPAPIARAK